MVIQQKTGRPVQFELTADVRASLLSWLERRGGTIDDYVFPSRIDRTGHLSTRQYARLVDEWVLGRVTASAIASAFGHVVLLPLHIRLNVLGRHQLHLVAEPG